ncbi:MAG TPA: sialidase family protein [Gaiellaceae bacterium]
MNRFPLTAVLAAVLLLPLASGADASGYAKATQVSRCGGPRNAEPVQAASGSYVYEAWIGCKGIGFARSTNGGKTFGSSITVRGSRVIGEHSWDPAITVAPNGDVYVAYMIGPEEGFGGTDPMLPVVAVSHNHGKSFARATVLPIPSSGHPNFGDRPFIAVGPNGAVYLTWDYGPRRDEDQIICPPSSSCYFGAGDFNAVFQKSTDGGKTWTDLAPISPDYPLGGVFSAPIVAEPNGALDVLYWQHPTDPDTFAISPGREYFIRSTDGGNSWSDPVLVGPQARQISVKTWWIDGSLAVDSAGTLYAAWDTQHGGRDTAWLARSTNHGASWSSGVQVASSTTEHLTQVTVAGRGNVYVAWQTIVPHKGYATFLRRYSVGHGWTGAAKKISPAYGNAEIWPGDTLGLSARNGTAFVSWGSAINKPTASSIWFAKSKLPAR